MLFQPLKVFLIVFTSLVTLSVQAGFKDKPVKLKDNELIVQVNGIVCSFCAYGTEKNLAKLKFLNKSKFGNGVLINIHTHRVTLALAEDKVANLSLIYKSIIKGGYDPIAFYFHLKGVVRKTGKVYSINHQQTGLTYILKGNLLTGLANNTKVQIKLVVKASEISKAKKLQSIPATVTNIGMIK